MSAKVIDLETARAARLSPRIRTTMDAADGSIVITFPRPIEQLILTPAKARFWIDSLTMLLVGPEDSGVTRG